MVLRLILVSLVAGLGFDMPTRNELDRMARSAETWVNARLADWDSQAPSDHESYVLVADPAPTSLPLAAPASAPVSVPDEEFVSVLDDNVALFAQDELAGTTRESDEAVKSTDQLSAVEASKSLAIELPVEPATVVSEDWIPNDVTDLVLEGWAEDAAAATRPVEVALTEPNPTPSLDLDRAFEGVIEETVNNFTQEATMLASVEPTPTDDSHTSEVARPTSTPSTAAVAEDGHSENRLTNAVRLTREAVIAWAGLLHGPAVVTIAP